MRFEPTIMVNNTSTYAFWHKMIASRVYHVTNETEIAFELFTIYLTYKNKYILEIDRKKRILVNSLVG